MVSGWMTCLVHCEECDKTYTTSLPSTWDGSPLMCSCCGETCAIEITGGIGR